ncbi:sigma-70 family RNA polymerase sigma factor [Streptomyces sp. NPDC049881]|uniref:RNA polymerase sigma factor n=1 Tax=Streptomyces sp. NPDC049881 TaxID=3155778 RepID=UPI003449E38D
MGEPERFREMYVEHYGAVLRYARRRVGEDAAPDVTAEVFATAWRRWDAVPGRALPWLYGVARNTVANHLRSRDQAARRRIEDGRERTARDVGEQVTARSAVRQAWAALSEPDRELLALIGWEGLTVREAARVLECTAATCSVRLHRARGRLRRALEQQEHGEELTAGRLEGQSWA